MITSSGRIDTESNSYQVDKTLGEGGFGIVYKVTDAQGKAYALKMATIWKQMPQDRQQVVSKFKLEYNIMRKLNELRSPHIVKAYDYGLYQDNPFMVIEFCPNGTLEQRIAKGMTPAETASVVGQVLQGLDASHQQGIIHRDLKPENILFGSDGMAKIADYGIAADVKNRQTRRNWMGLVNEVFATVVYAPPEQTNQRKAFHVYETNDIFAFGVILFEMLTQGQFPFGSEEDFAKDMGVTYQQRKEAGDWNRKLLAKHAPDPKWVGMMEKCLHPDPKMRFQRAGEMLAALGEVPLTPLKTREGNRKPGAWQLQVMSGDEIGRGYNLSNLLHYQHKKLLALGWFDAGNPYVNDVGIVEQHTTFISSRHATLEMEDLGGGVQQWYIRDGQFYEKNGQRGFHASTNGVLVNSQRVPPGAAERLQDGDIITVGDTTLKVVVG